MLVAEEPPEVCGEAEAQIGFLGAKGRLIVPIPYFAPFLDLGVGVSLGHIETRTDEIDEETSGAAIHYPFSLGFLLGEPPLLELRAQYYFHPREQQFGGALAIGITLPLD